ncbi:glycosyltransferase family protein [Acuticoccus sediminis]|uniref:hypothetical protein n=1 Tax=Acuticoccus sediminis TaxID=2184697 RepID=UPI001CFCFDF0|nr:hypothetical protein [Acuticoccus sediminis]
MTERADLEGASGRETAAPACGVDPEFERDVLSGWRDEGRALILRNWQEFNHLLDRSEALLEQGRYAHAAAAAQAAASYAVFWHPGVFHSAPLERLLHLLGAKALSADDLRGRDGGRGQRPENLRVLHVATQVGAVGGHVRMMWRWIREDCRNRHSVALTRQFGSVPASLGDAVERSGGAVSLLNHAPGSYLEWARRLRDRMNEADLVVLHSNSMDIIPFVALGGLRQRPPVVLLNHSDHMFWLGAGIADSVVNTRRSGRDLCVARRGIASERNLLLPLCLERIGRCQSREAAKQALGIDPTAVVMLSVARGTKYRSFGTQGYPDLMLPLLQSNPAARLIVIGPGGTVDWARAMRSAPGRISVLPETPDTKGYLEAADIYVDSFPFPSNTSLFEAGLHGLPLVTYFPFGSGCAVMGADSVGFDGSILRAHDRAELNAILAGLASDPERRARIGEQTRREIEATNFDQPWREAVAAIYERSLDLPQRVPEWTEVQRPGLDDVDVFQPFAFGNPIACAGFEDRLGVIQELEIRAMPLSHRAATLLDLARRRRLVHSDLKSSLRYLSPEWLSRRAQARFRKLRHA